MFYSSMGFSQIYLFVLTALLGSKIFISYFRWQFFYFFKSKIVEYLIIIKNRFQTISLIKSFYYLDFFCVNFTILTYLATHSANFYRNEVNVKVSEKL